MKRVGGVGSSLIPDAIESNVGYEMEREPAQSEVLAWKRTCRPYRKQPAWNRRQCRSTSRHRRELTHTTHATGGVYAVSLAQSVNDRGPLFFA